MYKVTLRKHRSTWYYFTENPQGGGFGSNYCGPKYIALLHAIRNIPQGESYRYIVNDTDCGIFVKQAVQS